MRVVTIVGARPQFVKAAIVSAAIDVCRESGGDIDERLVHTGQHYDHAMSDVFFDQLGMRPPMLNLGVGSGSHAQQTAKMMVGIESALASEMPDWVLLYGDTNSTLAGALVAAKMHLPVAHVEAGLRSFNRRMPEEVNRVLCDHVSRLCLCPTMTAVRNLATEGVTKGVEFVGDVMLDCVDRFLPAARQYSTILEDQGLQGPKDPGSYFLATVHRPENTEDPDRLNAIFAALGRLPAPVLVPLHPRTRNVLPEKLPGDIRILPPLSYLDMLVLQRSARMILTDSGGVQKEAYFLGVACVTLRDETEWVETVEEGWNIVAGAQEDVILQAVATLEGNPPQTGRGTAFGEGRAGESIVELLLRGADCG